MNFKKSVSNAISYLLAFIYLMFFSAISVFSFIFISFFSFIFLSFALILGALNRVVMPQNSKHSPIQDEEVKVLILEAEKK